MAWRLFLPILLLALALSACSRRPASWLVRDRTPPAALVTPVSKLGAVPYLTGAPVLVVPTQGLPNPLEGVPARLAKAIADALVEKDVLAATRSAGASGYILQTAVAGQDLRARLIGPDGLTVLDKAVRLDVPAGQLDAPAVDRLAGAVASAIVARPEGQPAAPSGAARVRIAGIEGAPGDGNRALALALEQDLARRGLVIADKDGPGAFVVRGKVEVERRDTRDHVVLLWQVSGPTGAGTATIRQENDVPAGALDGKWGLIAPAAASGGADGITEAIAAFTARGR
ncbi:MAG: hypothetical protein OJI70_01475 [Zavarzinia sp.]|nr:hypothetical protein [Zavarzinia sp.]